MVLEIFKIVLHLRDRHVFMWQSVETLNVFNTLTLKQIFWKTKTFFKKLEHRFLLESTNMENISFPCKTTISEANVKTNRMVNTKWIYHKERIFLSNYFIFWRFCFSLRTSYKELISCTQEPKCPYSYFNKLWNMFKVNNKDTRTTPN